jgi:hypothetical protein
VLTPWHTMVEVISHQGRGHMETDQPMEPEHVSNALTVETGRRGGLARAARQTPEERRALAKHAARARWHPQEAPLPLTLFGLEA